MGLFTKKKKVEYKYPWDRFYDEDKRTIELPDISIYSYLEKSCFERLDVYALNYFGVKITFKEFLEKIDLCAKALASSGVRCGDVVSICMPNTPEAVIMFFATNKIGAIANMIHPLSSKEEIKEALISTKSVFFQVININYEKLKDIIKETDVYKTVVVSARESMPSLLSLGYFLTNDLKINFESTEEFMDWNSFIERGYKYDKNVEVLRSKDDDAVYLSSGGSTGVPKKIVLTNGNINTITEQGKIAFPLLDETDRFLSILPIFHCFGLCVNVVSPLCYGCTITLVPQFDATKFDKLLNKYKPTVLIGVPTLFEAMIKSNRMGKVDLHELKYVISGGDSLSEQRNEMVNDFLKSHKSPVTITQGYGMTETSGPVTFGALGSDKLGSVGIPLPGNVIKILDVETREEKDTGEIGEICITGPSLMSRYLNNKKETEETIYVDDQKRRWVHTGDLGYMDKDGVFFYVQRLKRMLIVSGYNVYPNHLETVIMKHPKVEICGVIGVPHPYKVQVPVAYIVPKKGVEVTPELLNEIKDYCKDNLAKYMLPKKYIFKDALPKTMVGKINYKELEKEYDQ